MRQAALATAFVLLCAGWIQTADDPAKGHYESAMDFLRDGKTQQALDDLNFIVKSFPQNALADDALLQLGIYYLERQKNLDQALTYFQQIKDKYTDSNSAPAAYYYLGQIYLSKRNAADLDEAYADFERVTRVFPSSSWVDKSLVGAGTALKWRGDFEKAYEEFSKVKVRFANSPLAPIAQFEMGICSLYGDSYLEAAYDFQQAIDQYPGTDQAKMAAEFNTIIYRLYIAQNYTYKVDGTYSAIFRDMDDPTGMAVDSKGSLYLSDKGKKVVYTVDPAGKNITSQSIASPQSVFLDDRDQLFVANEINVVGPDKAALTFTLPREGKTPEPLEEIRDAAANKFRELYLISGKAAGILVYNQQGNFEPELPFSKTDREFAKVTVNSRNQVYAIDKPRKQLFLFAPDGKALLTLGPQGKGFAFEKIDDFAVDRTNHIYLLTKNPRGVLIFSPTGTLLKYIQSGKKGEPLSFEEGRLIAVGPSGAIYILDKDEKRILKIG